MKQIKNYVVLIYLFIMLGFFPLFYKKGYVGMGDGKYNVFLFSSIVCLGIILLLTIIQYFIFMFKDTSLVFSKKTVIFSHLDMAVILYFAIVAISYFFSDFKQEALLGANGWSMGLATQLIFFCSYFIISRDLKWNKHIFTVLFLSSAVVFLLGILHRFYIDPLAMYADLDEEYKLQFLSTIGQSSWYSSFVCTVFPVGLYAFYATAKPKIRGWFAVYCILGFSTIVTQNTDSAYLSIFAVFVLLFYFSRDNQEKRKRFYECLLLMFFSFKLMGVFQIIFKNHTIMLDSLSIEMSQGLLTTILLILTAVFYVFRYYIKPQNMNKPVKKYPFNFLLGIIGIAITGMIIFIVLNSNGYLYEKFAYCNTNNYLLFNDSWGNSRGFAWRFTTFAYKNLAVLQKLVGVGPDCYQFYLYGIPEYAEVLHGFWGDLSLTNAHNEYLTTLINHGIVGLVSFVGMFTTGIVTFIRNRKKNVLAAGFALCVIAYMVHNIFCYQQVCCTPFVFIFLGIGSNMIRNQITEEY